MAFRPSDEFAAKVGLQVFRDFGLDKRFQKNEHQAQNGLDSDLVLADSDPAVYTGSLKMNMVTFPTVVDFKLLGQVAREFIGCLLCLFGRHRVLRAHIYMRHNLNSRTSVRASLDAAPLQRQSPMGLGTG